MLIKSVSLTSEGLPPVELEASSASSLSRYASAGVQIRNKVFSDQHLGEPLDFHVQQQAAEAPVPWRVNYYDKQGHGKNEALCPAKPTR